ncbi:hypothetical protein B9G55_17430 [Saccharibacillus sp. O16]|nr:hypothetical protein B9G55_17430 [Saccharibacillus sp. O16]
MKKKIIAAAVAAALTLTASAGVYAGANLKEIRATLNSGLSLVVNGKTYTPKDANGKTLAPITYNGTTYLPVRSIGEALNTSVNYDAANSRVVIGGAAASGNSGNTGSPSPSSTSVKRPSLLPQDFPLPSDAKIFDVVQGTTTGKPAVTFSYLTKQNLETLGNQYKQYFEKKGASSKSEEVSASAFTIVDSSSTFNVSLTTSPGTGSSQGYTVVEVIWSGK